MSMPESEIIDLTDAPVLASTNGPQIADTSDTLSLPPSIISNERIPGKIKERRIVGDEREEEGSGERTPGRGKRKRKKNGEQNQQLVESRNEPQNTSDSQTNIDMFARNGAERSQKDVRQAKRKREDSSASASAAEFTVATANGIRAKEEELFFFDVAPVSVPSLPTADNVLPARMQNVGLETEQNMNDNGEAKLLLPAHVSALESLPVEILPTLELEDEGEDYINYLEYGDDNKFPRYFEEPESESTKLKRTVCKNCGAEGDHRTADCRVLICLTCGVRDEHVTKSCPVSKVCFSCGMKGHINVNCPNRYTRRREYGRFNDCERCFSTLHQTSECPTWWRIYQYVTEEERDHILSERRQKRDIPFLKGGEGYIAEDEWCYNCGEPGHWGDDCQETRRYDKPEEPSAFGLYNVASGPFFDASEDVIGGYPDMKGKARASRRPLRDWEREDEEIFGDWGKHAPNNVGKQGRRKAAEALGRNAQKVQDEDDEDDWFGRRDLKIRGAAGVQRPRSRERNGERERERNREAEKWRGRDKDNNRDKERNRNQPSNNEPKRLQISIKGAGREDRQSSRPSSSSLPSKISSSSVSDRQNSRGSRPQSSHPSAPSNPADASPRPSLLSRITDSSQSNSQPNEDSRDRSRKKYRDQDANDERRYDRDRDRGWERERDRKRQHQRQEASGPRYHGGYGR